MKIQHTFLVRKDAKLYAGQKTVADSLHQAVCDVICFVHRTPELKKRTLRERRRAEKWLRANTSGCIF